MKSLFFERFKELVAGVVEVEVTEFFLPSKLFININLLKSLKEIRRAVLIYGLK